MDSLTRRHRPTNSARLHLPHPGSVAKDACPHRIRCVGVLLAAVTLLTISASGCGRGRSLQQDLAAIEDPIFPDERRIGIIGIQRRDELRQESYQARLRQLATADPSASVRAQAARALNQARDPQAVPLFLTLLTDADARVRLEAIKGLRNQPDDRALARLSELAASEEQDREVRIWSTSALGRYPQIGNARALVALLDGRDFGVAFEARQSLRRLTGKDFHYEPGLWLTYLTGSTTPFVSQATASPRQDPRTDLPAQRLSEAQAPVSSAPVSSAPVSSAAR